LRNAGSARNISGYRSRLARKVCCRLSREFHFIDPDVRGFPERQRIPRGARPCHCRRGR
jgi:hypothetical protein